MRPPKDASLKSAPNLTSFAFPPFSLPSPLSPQDNWRKWIEQEARKALDRMVKVRDGRVQKLQKARLAEAEGKLQYAVSSYEENVAKVSGWVLF